MYAPNVPSGVIIFWAFITVKCFNALWNPLKIVDSIQPP